MGKVHLHAVVATCGAHAFGVLHVSSPSGRRRCSQRLLPFHATLGLTVKAVLTDNGREFCGTEKHPCELHLDLNGIEHRRTKARTPKANGFVERFNRTVLEEFLRINMRETFCRSVARMQADLDVWLVHDNTERPHPGDRDMGRRPIGTVMPVVRQDG